MSGEAQQGADKPLRRLVERETLQALFVIEPALHQHLHERDAETRLAFDLFLDLSPSPRHQRDIIQSDGAFRHAMGAEQRAFTEEIVDVEDIHHSLRPILHGNRHFDAPLYYQMESFGRVKLIENGLTAVVIRDALTRQIHQGIFDVVTETWLEPCDICITPEELSLLPEDAACLDAAVDSTDFRLSQTMHRQSTNN